MTNKINLNALKKHLKRKSVLSILLLSLVLVFAICYFLGSGETESPLLLQVTRAKTSVMPSLFIETGQLTAAEEVLVVSKSSGKVKGIYFEEGWHVVNGDPIIQLEDEVAENRLLDSQEKFDVIRKFYEEQKRLHEIGGVDDQNYRFVYEKLLSVQEKVRESLVSYRETSQRTLVDGIVKKILVKVGQRVRVGQKLVVINNKEKMQVEYEVPDQTYQKLRVYQTVIVTSEFFPEKLFVGVIQQIQKPSVVGHPAKIKLLVYNQHAMLMMGMKVTLTHKLSETVCQPSIPVSAVFVDSQGYYVFKYSDKKLHLSPVELSGREHKDIAVRKGVKIGEFVVSDATSIKTVTRVVKNKYVENAEDADDTEEETIEESVVEAAFGRLKDGMTADNPEMKLVSDDPRCPLKK